MGIFKKGSKLQVYTQMDKNSVCTTILADVGDIGDPYEKEDIAVALILPSLEGKMHFSILHLWIAIALKVKYVIHTLSEDTYLDFCRNNLIDKANEACARQFNRLPDYYLFVDEDSAVQANLFDALKESLEKNKIDIVSADYIRKRGWIPVWTPVKYFTEWNQKWKFKRGELIEVITTGAGALLVKGEVLRKIPPPWFKVISDTSTYLGEDAYFCQQLRDHGYKVWVDTGVVIGHQGAVVFPWDWEKLNRQVRDSKDVWNV